MGEKGVMIRTRGWTNAQIEILKEAYSRDDISIQELTLLVNKSETAICVMAKNLNLKKPKLKKIQWTEEEVEFLKRVYPEFDNTISEISEILGKKEYAIKIKAKELGLIKKSENEHLFAIGKKRCPKCKEIYILDDFQKNSSKLDGLSSNCKYCCSITRKKINEKPQNNNNNNDLETLKKCNVCKEVKVKSDFYEGSGKCKECRKIQMKERKLKDLIEKGYC